MNRNEKIKLLKDIHAGIKKIEDLQDPAIKIRVWIQDKDNPEWCQCEADNLLVKPEEIYKNSRTNVINVMVISSSVPLAGSEEEVCMRSSLDLTS